MRSDSSVSTREGTTPKQPMREAEATSWLVHNDLDLSQAIAQMLTQDCNG